MAADMPARAGERKFVDLALDRVEADGTFSGYASLFGAVDLGKDLVERGAFAKALRERGAAGIRMLFQHDPANPIGTWSEIREDRRGLFVRGRLTTDVARAREVHALMRAGALDGLSIGFRTVKARRESATGIRRILEADLWEISVVTFPMLPGARIETVKSRRARLPTVREFETWLTRDAGLSRSDAKAVIAKGFASLVLRRDAVTRKTQSLVETIRRAARLINPKGHLQ
jgi:HK97 family phage prohead protease